MKTFYRRHLPHWQPDGAVVFITFRLFGSLPQSILDKIGRLRENLKIEMDKGKMPGEEVMLRAQRLFELLDDSLDQVWKDENSMSPRWLDKPEVAGVVRDAMKYYEGDRFLEHRYVIMPNHVHWLIEPLPGKIRNIQEGRSNETGFWSLASIMKSVKGYSGKEGNRILGRSCPFWQEESYDHWIRDQKNYDRIIEYINVNPVKAGLCEKPEDWQWSSAGEQNQ